MAQTGSDDLLRQIGGGDQKARQDAYYKFHHTAPDEATKSRVGKMMPYEQQSTDRMTDNVVTEQGSQAFKY